MKQAWNMEVPGVGMFRIWGERDDMQGWAFRHSRKHGKPGYTVTPASDEDRLLHEYTDLEEME